MDPRPILAVTVATGLLGMSAAVASPAYAEEAATSRAGTVPLPGEDLEQSGDREAPTPVTAGAWRGELGPYETREGTRWYSYERVTDDSSLLVSVISPGADPALGDGIELEVFTPDGDSCTVGPASDDRLDDDPSLLATELWVGVQEAMLSEDSTGPECLTQNRLLISVSRGSEGERGEAPYAMRVVEEAPLEPRAAVAGAVELGEPQAPDVDSEREERDGAPGLLEAPEITTGRYRGATATDRTVVYRVPEVGWGQSLRTSVSVDAPDTDEDLFLGPDVSLRVLSPMWSSVGTATNGPSTLTSGESSDVVTSAGPVRYGNRLTEIGTDSTTFVPGDYYVMLTVAPVEEGDELDLDYTLEVEVAGEVEDPPAFVTDDAYLVAEGDEQPEVTAVGEGGFLASLTTVLRYAGAALLALVGVVALLAGVRTLRTSATA